jgi:hypothetical protein
MKSVMRTLRDHDNDPDQAMTIDIVVDDDLSVRPRVAFCGWWGRLGSTELDPLVVMPDGRVAFGSESNTNQPNRYGRINIHSKHIKIGEYVTYYSREDGEEKLFRIKAIIDLLDL